MTEQKSILKQIREHLRNEGFETYYPTQHKGECTTEYVVVKYSGATQHSSVSSDMPIYELLCYVPEENYSRIVEFVEEVKEAMRGMFPLVRQSGNETSSFYDEKIKAHMVSVEYVNYRKIEYRR